MVTAALIVAGATSAGGVSVLAVKKLRKMTARSSGRRKI